MKRSDFNSLHLILASSIHANSAMRNYCLILGINDHACIQESKRARTHTYIHLHVHNTHTVSSKDVGLDHECGLVDCITIVKCLWHNDASSCDVVVIHTRARAYDRAARARVGRWAILSNDPRKNCSRMFAQREAWSRKFDPKSKQDRSFRFAKSLFVSFFTSSKIFLKFTEKLNIDYIVTSSFTWSSYFKIKIPKNLLIK